MWIRHRHHAGSLPRASAAALAPRAGRIDARPSGGCAKPPAAFDGGSTAASDAPRPSRPARSRNKPTDRHTDPDPIRPGLGLGADSHRHRGPASPGPQVPSPYTSGSARGARRFLHGERRAGAEHQSPSSELPSVGAMHASGATSPAANSPGRCVRLFVGVDTAHQGAAGPTGMGSRARSRPTCAHIAAMVGKRSRT